MEDQAVYNIENYTAPPAMQSPEIGKLAEALAKAQAEMEPATKDANNPFFKSQYASLASCWQACRGPLTKHGLAIIQTTEPDNGNVTVISILTHSSGQWIKGKLSVKPPKTDSQALGSCLSYLRRYSLSALVGLSTQDDDAESTMSRQNTVKEKTTTKKAAPKKTNMKKFIEAVTPIAEKMGPEVFDAFMTENNVKSLDELTNREAQTDFYNKLKAA
jgi:hypothetical protein